MFTATSQAGAEQPAQEQAPAPETKADDNGLDDDVIDIFNMFKNK